MKRILLLLSLSLLYLGALAQQLVKFEYWFDRDSEHRVAVATEHGDIDLSVDVKALHQGIHTLTFRALDTDGRWSSPMTTFFMRLQANGESSREICEYWFDDDIEQRMSATAVDGMLSLSVNANSLRVGVHSFHFRVKDDLGRWSVPVTTYFMRVRNGQDGSNTFTYEYWIDENTDQRESGNSSNGLITLQVDAKNLKAGFHCLSLRTCDESGNWSSPITQYFVKPYTDVQNLVSGYYYWFNNHIEDAQLVRLGEPASPLMLEVNLPMNNLELEVTRENITMLSTDDGRQLLAIKNVLSMQFIDQHGNWSEVVTDTFATAVGDRVTGLTSFIVNPEADEQWKGWTTEGNRSLATDGHWSGNNNHFRLGNGKDSEMRQTVSGLPAGTYILSAYGKVVAGQLTMSVAGYVTEFSTEGDENGWSQSSVTFVTDGGSFDIVVSATGISQGEWACIDGFEMTVNGIADKAGVVSLSDVQIASTADLSNWNNPGNPVRLQLAGRYNNKKDYDATIYYSIDNGTAIRLVDTVTPGSKFLQEVECFFRENASPHVISLYGKDTNGVMSEPNVIEIGNIVRGCTVENLPQQVFYTGDAVTIDNLALRDNRTGKLLSEGEDYTILYHNNVDDGLATIIVEGVYPRYMGRRELHFTIKSYIDIEELAVLRSLYEQTAGESLWIRKWDVQKEQVLSDELKGVNVKNRHVTAIQLRGNRLTGQLPDVLFTLPNLQTLNLEDNNLSGTINTSGIKPTLHELLLAGNGLSFINSIVPSTVTRISLGGQTINEVSELHLSQSALQHPSLPNIGLYDHQQQDFGRQADIRLMTGSYNGTPLAILSRRGGQWQMNTDEWGGRVYHLVQGDTIYCTDDVGNRFRLALTFEDGDVNIDGLVNVQDLSATVLYCLNNYQSTFNYTAANLWMDDRINVQDAVCLVNILLESMPPAVNQDGMNTSRMAVPANQRAFLSMSNGQLILSSAAPVSAFDFIVEGVNPEEVTSLIEPFGFMISKRKHGNGTHIVGFSPVGSLLPIGETVLCDVATRSNSQVTHALLSDDRAKRIAVIVTETTGINEIGFSEMNVTFREGKIVMMTTKQVSNVRWTLYSVGGAVLDCGTADCLSAGISQFPLRLGKGDIGILHISADGHQSLVRKIRNK